MPLNLDFARPATRRDWRRRLLGLGDDAAWEGMARELFAWQFGRIPAYRRLCLAHGVEPGRLNSWRDVPAVPQQLFKAEKLFAYEAEPTAVYETSGTTTGQPGRQYLLRTDLYRAVSVEGARRAGFLDDVAELHFLMPSPRAAPHSSLSAMFDFWRKAAASKGSRFWARRGEFAFDDLRVALEKSTRPVALCGTAFSFVHLLDAWADRTVLRLPPGSCVLETGGFKGRSREVSKPELYAQIGQLFDLPTSAIWNEYGMSELSSQAYAQGVEGLHQTPPWARVLVCDPATGKEVRLGQRGLVRWIDLANTDSVFAVQTLDLAERTREGFRLLGRLPRTEARGCSLSAEDLGVNSARRQRIRFSSAENAGSIHANG